MIQDVENAKCVKVWCDAICGGAMLINYVANTMALSECGVEYMECGAMWYVRR